MRRLLLTRRWMGLTAFMVVLVIAFCALGWWQWQRATETGSPRSFGYSLEWPAFAIMVIMMYVKTFRDELRGGPSSDDARMPRRKRGEADGPATATAPSLAVKEARPDTGDEDEEVAAYNRYLAQLSAGAAQRGR